LKREELGRLYGVGGEDCFNGRKNYLVEVCRGLVLGVVRKDEEEDRWQWDGESYTVKKSVPFS
jgi:hypothetical protein